MFLILIIIILLKQLAGAGLLCIYIGVTILEPPIEFANEFFVLGLELIATMFAVMIILYVTFPEPSDDSPLVFHVSFYLLHFGTHGRNKLEYKEGLLFN